MMKGTDRDKEITHKMCIMTNQMMICPLHDLFQLDTINVFEIKNNQILFMFVVQHNNVNGDCTSSQKCR